MGYDISVRVRIAPIDRAKEIFDALEKEYGEFDNREDSIGEANYDCTRWSSLTEDMTEFSKSFPGVLFDVFGDCTDPDCGQWAEFFRDGKTYQVNPPSWEPPAFDERMLVEPGTLPAEVEAPEIHKLMVLSTAHISKECNDLLEELTAEDSRSADELLKAAQAVINRWDSPRWEWNERGETANLIADLRIAIANYKPDTSSWISVDEKMPLDGQFCLVCYYPWNNRSNALAVQEASWKNGLWITTQPAGTSYPPTHWMLHPGPVPPAPPPTPVEP